jgi:hypothetical protein
MNTLETKTQTSDQTKACPPERRGSGLIFAVVLLFVILAMVVTLSSVTMLETKMNQKTKSSVGAFYGSESGVEWALNKLASSSSGAISTAFTLQADHSANCPDAFGTNACKVFLLDQNGKVIIDSSTDLSLVKAVRSVGTQGDDTQRAIEAAVASEYTICSAVPTEIDNTNQSAVDLKTAATACRERNNCWHLPSLEELITFSGINNDTVNWLWTTTAYYGSGASYSRYLVVRMDNGSWGQATDVNPLYPYRCVR